jgi:hypothetical protein
VDAERDSATPEACTGCYISVPVPENTFYIKEHNLFRMCSQAGTFEGNISVPVPENTLYVEEHILCRRCSEAGAFGNVPRCGTQGCRAFSL